MRKTKIVLDFYANKSYYSRIEIYINCRNGAEMKKLYEDLTENGVDIEHTMERFMDNEAIYERFLKKFLSDPNYELLGKSLHEKNYEDALSSSHTLKGVCGNLGMNVLFKKLEKMVTDIRAGEYSTLDAQYEDMKPNYESIYAIISNSITES